MCASPPPLPALASLQLVNQLWVSRPLSLPLELCDIKRSETDCLELRQSQEGSVSRSQGSQLQYSCSCLAATVRQMFKMVAGCHQDNLVDSLTGIPSVEGSRVIRERAQLLTRESHRHISHCCLFWSPYHSYPQNWILTLYAF